MSAEVCVDLTVDTPTYQQIREQVGAHVAAGTLRVGERLPTVRRLARDLGLPGEAVARAYRDLEADGLLIRRRRAITVTAAGPRTVPDVVDPRAEGEGDSEPDRTELDHTKPDRTGRDRTGDEPPPAALRLAPEAWAPPPAASG